MMAEMSNCYFDFIICLIICSPPRGQFINLHSPFTPLKRPFCAPNKQELQQQIAIKNTET